MVPVGVQFQWVYSPSQILKALLLAIPQVEDDADFERHDDRP